MAQSTRELTSGTIWKQVVSFALPLLAASLVQLLYNFVNQVFAGQFIGTNASAAIAASALLLACLVNFFNGLGVGASVIVSRHFVQDNHDDYSKALHTAAAIAVFGGTALMVAGIEALHPLDHCHGTRIARGMLAHPHGRTRLPRAAHDVGIRR